MNVETLRARPVAGSRSDKILTPSRPTLPPSTGNGYSTVSVTHSRPLASNAMFIGLAMSGSAATSWASNPGGSLNVACSCSGDSLSVGATTLGMTGGAAAAAAAATSSDRAGTARRPRRADRATRDRGMRWAPAEDARAGDADDMATEGMATAGMTAAASTRRSARAEPPAPSPPYPGERVGVRGRASNEAVSAPSVNGRLTRTNPENDPSTAFGQPPKRASTDVRPLTLTLSPGYGGEGTGRRPPPYYRSHPSER